MQYGFDIKIKKFNPRFLLNSVKDSFLAWIGVSGTQLTLNEVAFSNVKTIKKTIGAVGVAGCDFNFATAANVTEQPIDLGAIVPAFARVLDIKTRTIDAFAAKAISIASWAVASNVVTIVTTVAHGLASTNEATIAGMAEATLNGVVEVTVSNATTFTFSLTHADANTTAVTAGTVTATITLVAETGNATSGNQFIASATIAAKDAITAVAHTGSLNAAPVATASKVWVSATPGSNWALITSGKVDVYITYIEI